MMQYRWTKKYDEQAGMPDEISWTNWNGSRSERVTEEYYTNMAYTAMFTAMMEDVKYMSVDLNVDCGITKSLIDTSAETVIEVTYTMTGGVEQTDMWTLDTTPVEVDRPKEAELSYNDLTMMYEFWRENNMESLMIASSMCFSGVLVCNITNTGDFIFTANNDPS